MKFRKTKLATLMLAACCSSSLVSAELYKFDATSDVQTDEPTEQGWQGFSSLSGTGSSSTSEGLPEWIAQGVNGRAQWRQILPADLISRASSYGWRLTTDMKMISGGYITNYYADGATRVLPIVSLDSNGDLSVQFEGETDSTILAKGADATAYHKYELVFHPGDTPTASFYFDGELVKDQLAPRATTQNMLVWGNGSSNIDGVAAYRDVQFEVQGQTIFFGPNRIPSIVASSETPGVVTAFAEKRESSNGTGGDPGSTNNTNNIITRVSQDGGVTWGATKDLTSEINTNDEFDFSDPRPIYDSSTDKVLVSYVRWPTGAAQNGDAIRPWLPSGVFYSTYDVKNNDWIAPVDVTDQVKERSYQIVGWEGAESYQRSANLDSTQDWRLDTTLRIYNGDANEVTVSDGSHVFSTTLSITANGDLVATLNGVAAPVAIKEHGDDAHGFQDYAWIYDAASKQVALQVNGTEVASWPGEVSSSNQVAFGNVDAAIDGRIHMQDLELTQQGQTLVSFDAYYLAQQDPSVTVTDLQQLGWTKVKSGNTFSTYGNSSVNPGPGHGIRLTNQDTVLGTHNGRLIYPAITLDRFFLNVMSVYSDDAGTSWHYGANLPLPFQWERNILKTLEPSESDLVELDNGHLLLTSRLDFNHEVNKVDYGVRQQFLSKDGGETWDLLEGNNASLFTDISGGTVDASITRFTEADGTGYLLFTNPEGSPAGATGGAARQNLGLWFSFDEGTSWKGPIQLIDGASAYSDIYQLDADTAIVIVETNGSDMRILRLPIPLMKQMVEDI